MLKNGAEQKMPIKTLKGGPDYTKTMASTVFSQELLKYYNTAGLHYNNLRSALGTTGIYGHQNCIRESKMCLRT